LPLRQWRYFLFALLLPLPVVLVIVLEAVGLHLAQPDFSLTGALQESSAAKAFMGWAAHGVSAGTPVMLNVLLIGQLLVMAVMTTPLLWGEEFGWRGYLQPRLLPGRPVLAAGVMGLIWGVWHYPLILRGYDYGDDVALGSVVFLVSTALISFIFGWLVERTGSIWSSSLAHAATNVVGGGLSSMWLSGAHHQAITSYAGLLAWPPLLIVCWGMWVLRVDRGHAGAGRMAPNENTPA
jgi:membrane protease YdiL (CAAX protease family)